MRNSLTALTLVVAALLSGCATNPSGRKQMLLIGDTQMNQMGLTAFQQMKTTDKLSSDPAKAAYIQCITDALVHQLDPEFARLPWEVAVFNHKAANAFALPGGKVGVHTGMFPMATSADEMAAVLSHEISHVTHRHGSERVSQQMAAQVGLAATQAYVGRKASPEEARTVVGLLGAGAQVGVLLPFSRAHELEADLAGQQLMARAGFDPAASITLWQKMGSDNPARSPQFLSTHPDPDRRVERLTERLQKTAPVFQQAISEGRRPLCAPPRSETDK
jgi:predicted Zn-dependent protease